MKIQKSDALIGSFQPSGEFRQSPGSTFRLRYLAVVENQPTTLRMVGSLIFACPNERRK